MLTGLRLALRPLDGDCELVLILGGKLLLSQAQLAR